MNENQNAPQPPVHVPVNVAPVQPQQQQPPVYQAPQPQAKLLEVEFEPDLKLYVSPETVDDMRFLELYEQVASSSMYIPKLLKFLFGEKEYEGIHDYYQKKGQKFTITKMEQVFEKLDTDLNSNPDFLRQ